MKNGKKWLYIPGIIIFLVLIIIGSVFWRLANAKGTLLKEHIEHDGVTRSYYLYIPEDYKTIEKMPLVFNFHGYKSNAYQNILYGDFRSIADRERFFLVYPQGLKHKGDTHWNVGGWTPDSTVDDVGFIDTLINKLEAEYNIDMNRIFTTGMSNGGAMSFHLAINLGHRFAAIASVAATMTPETKELATLNDPEPMPLMLIYGTDDKIVPFESGIIDSRVLPLEETLEFWLKRNGLENKLPDKYLLQNKRPLDRTETEHHIYTSGYVPMEVYRVINGGHTWPGAPGLLGFLGRTSRDFDAAETIWDFFSQF